jgi:UDP-glucuronate decarboxylase
MNPVDGRVVSNFIVQALQGQDITIFGDGLQTRSISNMLMFGRKA